MRTVSKSTRTARIVPWLLAFLLLAALLVWRGTAAAAPLTRASAAPAASDGLLVTIVGAKQGQFKGEGTAKGSEGKLVGLGYGFELSSPRDASTGQATGRRQFKPITFTKQVGAATPQILAALSTNEVLTSVLFEFFHTSPNGQQSVVQTVKLTNASISDDTQHSTSPGDPNVHELEEISLTFQKIEVQNNTGKTTYIDDWEPSES
jgi:type VI secretion system secreted protein Hcp